MGRPDDVDEMKGSRGTLPAWCVAQRMRSRYRKLSCLNTVSVEDYTWLKTAFILGRGGTSIYGKHFADEIHPGLKHAGAGILSMANAGPDTNGSQFFITLGPTAHLDGKHAIFGRICGGMKVIERLGRVETGKDDKPIHEVKIVRAYPVTDLESS